MRLSVLFAVILPEAVLASTNDVLRTTAEINAFYRTDSSECRAFDISGAVLNTTDSTFTLEDETGRIWLGYHYGHGLSPADRVNVKGKAYLSPAKEPMSALTQVRILGKTKAKPPTDIDLALINDPKNDLLPVRIVGKVIDIQPDETDVRYQILLLKSGATRLPLFVKMDNLPAAATLIDATIRATGTFNRSIRGVRKYSGAYVSGDRIEVIAKAPDDPFDVPQLERTRYMSPEEVIAIDKRKISGETLATWAPFRLMILADDGRIVNVKLSSVQTLPEPGDCIDIVGYPETDLFRINLMNARWRMSPQQHSPPVHRDEVPQEADIAAILCASNGTLQITDSFHGRLLRFRGIVRTMPTAEGPERRFSVDSRSSKVVVDISTHPEAASKIEIGSEIEITGRCLIETGEWSPCNIFPRASSFAIVIRSADDIRIIRTPPWWTPGRFLCSIAILLVVLTAIVLWNLSLHIIVRRRTQAMLREQIEKDRSKQRVIERTHLAYELHDALSQNLTGVALELKTASKAMDHNTQTALQHIKRADHVLRACREELRNCLWDLRNDPMGISSLSDAVRMTIAPHLGDTELTLDFSMPHTHLPDNTVHTILRIVRELTANAVRHGKATRLEIIGRVDKRRILTVTVRDNGCGFDPETAPGPPEGHFGLHGIRERLATFDGKLQIESSSEGTVASATVNLNTSKEPQNEKNSSPDRR